jgi:hypothetical protein
MMVNSFCLANGSETIDPWPQSTTESIDYCFENNFTPSQPTFQPLPDKEEYLQRLGEYTPVISYYIIQVLYNHQMVLHV